MTDQAARAELAEYCTNLIEGIAFADTGEEAAEHIATTLGWRPPARVIETPDELDAMPIGAAVLDAFAAVCTCVHTDPITGWVRATSAVGGGQHRHRPYLPATVLWEPEQEAQR